MDRLFGFLLGATTAGAGMYYYVIDEYRVSNELLTEDIYVRLLLPSLPSSASNHTFSWRSLESARTTHFRCAEGTRRRYMGRIIGFNDHTLTQLSQALQSAVQRIEAYVKTLEEKVDAKKRK